MMSRVNLKIEYYTFTLNTLVEELNKLILHHFKSSSTNNFILYFVEKYIKMKRSFLKDFCNNYGEKDKNHVNQGFNYNKFGSFGRYFFNNLIGIVPEPNVKNIIEDRQNHNLYKRKSKERINDLLWKNYLIREDNVKIDNFYAIYFNTILLNWKVSILKEIKEKSNTCRVCEKKFSSKDFMLHSWVCKEINSYVPEIDKFTLKIENLIDDLIKQNENMYICLI